MQLDFHELLQPYRKAKPQLTLEMIFNTMINHYKFPSSVVGEAVWKTFDEMANGLTFTGNGTTRVEALTYYIRDALAYLNKLPMPLSLILYALYFDLIRSR